MRSRHRRREQSIGPAPLMIPGEEAAYDQMINGILKKVQETGEPIAGTYEVTPPPMEEHTGGYRDPVVRTVQVVTIWVRPPIWRRILCFFGFHAWRVASCEFCSKRWYRNSF